MGMIYHWCPDTDWQAADETYSPQSFAADEFVHCSFRSQVEATATAVNRGRDDLVLLCVDDDGLPVKVEDSYNIGESFPHVYAPLPTSSVVAAVPFPPSEDGSFVFPSTAPT